MPFSSPPKPDLCKAIFLDRDGVINHDPGDYTRSIEEFSILPTALEALRILAEKGYIFILITNQGGIAKGLYSHNAVNEIHNHLRNLCKENGSPLTDIYYSPHHEITGLSLSRKPGSMMVERAIARYNINPAESWIIGDKQRDLDCASILGVQGVLIPTNGALIDYIHSLV